jgi:hypothetical protein
LKILIVAAKTKEEENQHFGVWPRAGEIKLVIGKLCCSLSSSFFQIISLFDLIFSLDSKSL